MTDIHDIETIWFYNVDYQIIEMDSYFIWHKFTVIVTLLMCVQNVIMSYYTNIDCFEGHS